MKDYVTSWSKSNEKTGILTDDGLKLAYTIAKGQDARFNSITQGIQKINCQW